MKIDQLFSVSGKHCIVTGASRGIGRALAEALLENGAKVVLMSTNQDKLDRLVEEFRAQGYDAFGVAGDLSRNEETLRMFDEGLGLLDDRLDVMVPCAGIQYRCATEDFPLEQFDRIMKVNLYHVFLMSQRALQVMVKQPNGGKIVMIGSLGSHIAGRDICAYSTSKGAVEMLCKSFARNCADKKININILSPGWIATEIWADMTDERKAEAAAAIPQGRVGKPEDLKGAMLFLASTASDYINGAEIVIDGALLTKL